jgi:dipeptidyl-peptidase-4
MQATRPASPTALLALSLATLLTLVGGSPARAADTAATSLSIDRLFNGPDLAGASLRKVRFAPDGKSVTFLQGKPEAKDRLDLWALDVASGERRLLVDSATLQRDEGRLSPEEEARRERQRTSSLAGIVDYEFSGDGRLLLLPLGGDLFVYDLRAARGSSPVQRLTSTPAAETDARFSPDGRYVSFVREQNLYAIELATRREIAVTRDGAGLVSFGTAEFIAQEEMDRDTGYWWSPDSRRIAYMRVDEAPVDEVERFEINAENVQVIRQRYPAAGRPNARVELFVRDLDAASPGRKLDAAGAGDGYLARVDWFPDSKSLAVQRQSRDQKTLELLRVAIGDGSARTLLTERSDTWVPLHDELAFLKQQPAFVWASQRSGYKHLYLYDLDGKLIRPVTAGAWMVVGDGREPAVEWIDEARQLVYFTANRDTPIDRHLYVASYAGKENNPKRIDAAIRRLSQGDGWHSITMAQGGLWLDNFSTPERPPTLTLRKPNGAAIATLVANELDARHPYAPYLAAHRPTQFGTLTAADGQTLHYKLLTPRDMQPGRKYPVIVSVYGGPGNQNVRRAWGGYFDQYLAQHGYVVFTLDNRGAGFRGAGFEGALHRKLGHVEVEDQVRGVEFLRTLPYVDARRVGVFGWSYGGYMALMCMVRAPDYFTAGVAGAPVTDWKLYDTHYTERYMGTPADNAEGYRNGMVMTHAANLRGPLLVMHGMADDNVLITHSTALFKRLQDLRKQYDSVLYPGSKHGLLRFKATGLHGYETIERFFGAALRDPQATPDTARH